MRFIITGSFGVGKTSVIDGLKKQDIPLTYLDEVARALILRENKKPKDIDTKKDIELFQRKILFTQMYQETVSQNFVADRGVVDTVAYTKDTDIYETIFDICQNYLRLDPYDHIFFIPKEFPIIDDGIRNTNEAYQQYIEDTILEIMHKMGLSYTTLSGSIDERIYTITQSIKTMPQWKNLTKQ